MSVTSACRNCLRSSSTASIGLRHGNTKPSSFHYFQKVRSSSTSTTEQTTKDVSTDKTKTKEQVQTKPKQKKTMAQLDEELRLKMAGASGDGGEAGVELEDGKPVSMKRGVRENMFRYI